MDKQEKFEQTKSIDKYLEDNQVYELFLGLLKQLIVTKPDDPIEYIITKLQKPASK